MDKKFNSEDYGDSLASELKAKSSSAAGVIAADFSTALANEGAKEKGVVTTNLGQLDGLRGQITGELERQGDFLYFYRNPFA